MAEPALVSFQRGCPGTVSRWAYVPDADRDGRADVDAVRPDKSRPGVGSRDLPHFRRSARRVSCRWSGQFLVRALLSYWTSTGTLAISRSRCTFPAMQPHFT